MVGITETPLKGLPGYPDPDRKAMGSGMLEKGKRLPMVHQTVRLIIGGSSGRLVSAYRVIGRR